MITTWLLIAIIKYILFYCNIVSKKYRCTKCFNVIQFYEDILYEKKPTIKSFCGIEKIIENLLIFIYLYFHFVSQSFILILIVYTVGRNPVKKSHKYKKNVVLFFWFERVETNSAKHSIELCFHRVKVLYRFGKNFWFL